MGHAFAVVESEEVVLEGTFSINSGVGVEGADVTLSIKNPGSVIGLSLNANDLAQIKQTLWPDHCYVRREE
jgi:hypothetical protein